ncbi:oligosaccharide flippase family protein [Primorskyibacter flagellatus]|uniref:Membrane protein involved in the export of O-antigen and teichoic acid n=1 Tax=Primorskyibacter flagellatus TaxID=1387277 RepID=A0A1W2E172_9RHOB|nr:oligosaccharide flippase family protein [Primorskyibacter flagellatus]SMD03207.1 Membrane protein involved in the export of O-antigen and teichoic acid [Primorskyibacter flagellatus]
MLGVIRTKLSGDGLGARVMRGSALTFMGFGTSQFLRLGSNLIVTRLLFPEAFGLMAIMTLFLTGLQMVSDIGLTTGIVRSKRGDDPVFLNTCWTLQIIRGVLLAAICCIIAGPVARFYGEPILHELMYGVAFTVFVMGLRSTRIATATRKILLGRLTLLDLGSQVLSILSMIVLAMIWESVWALMIGMIVANMSKAVLSHVMLPGHPSRLTLERAAVLEQYHFGKYLFVSSGLTFVIDNGDRILLSKFLSLSSLAFYNIAYFFASVPLILMGNFVNRIVYPLYSAHPPAESEANRRAISKTRFALTGGMFTLLFGFGLLGQWLIELLYTENYWQAGPILVALTVSLMPNLIVQGYAFVLLANGKSGTYTGFQLFRAVLQTTLLTIGLMQYGLIGALVAQPVAVLLTYPVLVYLIRPYKAEDPLHDIVFTVLTLLSAGIVFWLNGDALSYVINVSMS